MTNVVEMRERRQMRQDEEAAGQQEILYWLMQMSFQRTEFKFRIYIVFKGILQICVFLSLTDFFTVWN